MDRANVTNSGKFAKVRRKPLPQREHLPSRVRVRSFASAIEPKVTVQIRNMDAVTARDDYTREPSGVAARAARHAEQIGRHAVETAASASSEKLSNVA